MGLDPNVIARNYVRFTESGDSALVALMSEDFVDHVSGRRGPGIWHTVAAWLDASFADRRVELHAVATTGGDRVLVWVTVHATHVGSEFPWMGDRAPTGKTIAWKQVHIFRTDREQIVEHWAVRDDLRVLETIDAAN